MSLTHLTAGQPRPQLFGLPAAAPRNTTSVYEGFQPNAGVARGWESPIIAGNTEHDRPAYPSPSPLARRRCPFSARCVALNEGRASEADPSLTSNYRPRVAADPAEGRLGGLTWSVVRGAAPPQSSLRALEPVGTASSMEVVVVACPSTCGVAV
jgi:hypothetical protein